MDLGRALGMTCTLASGCYVFIHRAIVLAVFTAEGTLGAGLTLVSIHTPTLKVLVTVGTPNCSKLTANKPLVQFLV